jgi:lipid II:glycine glycyltransferase (peptidoglycan interpeptide bridge formation enzyme)
VKKEGWKYIELRPLTEWSKDSAGFEESGKFYFHRMDLRPPLELIFRNLHKSCTQRKIRRAEREELTCEQGRSEALLRKFYQLLLKTCRRRQLPPQPIAWFRHLIESMGEGLTIYLASKNDRPIAGIMTLSFKRSVVYKYGCSDARYNSLGGMQFLLWNAMQDAKRDGLHEFDFGRSDFHTPGLVTFKDRWATTRSVITYMRCETPSAAHIGTDRTMRFARQFFAHMPDPFLIAAGKTLYRHIG